MFQKFTGNKRYFKNASVKLENVFFTEVYDWFFNKWFFEGKGRVSGILGYKNVTINFRKYFFYIKTIFRNFVYSV